MRGWAGPPLACAHEPEILSGPFDYRNRPWSIISLQAHFCSSCPWRLTPPGKQDVQREEPRLREGLLASRSLLILRKAPHLQETRSSLALMYGERHRGGVSGGKSEDEDLVGFSRSHTEVVQNWDENQQWDTLWFVPWPPVWPLWLLCH